MREIAKALSGSWNQLDEAKLRGYARKVGNAAVTKRLGFLMETLGLGDPDNAEIIRSKNVILCRDSGIKTHAMNKRLEEAHRWLRQAQEDIAAARDVHEDGRCNWSCFMAQQAAEKALKAVYVGRGEPVEWIHSCLILIQGDPEKRLAGIPEMKDLTAAARDLDKAYIPSRYPNGVPHGIPSDFFTQEDSQRCLTHAEAIVTRCNQFLPTT